MKKVRIAFLSVLALFVHTGLTLYIGWNGWAWLHASFGLQDKWGYGIILIILSYSYIIGRFVKKFHLISIIGSYWLAIIQYAVLLLPIANLIYLILLAAGIADPDNLVKWIGSVVLIAFLLLFGFGTYFAYSPSVRKYRITIPKQTNGRKSLRIAMASDMHFGNLSGLTHLRRLVIEMKALKPDIILLPGDIIDDDLEPFMRKSMGDVMQELNAPLGVYGVLGNHEYYGGAIPEFLKEMERIGVTMLLDRTVMVDHSFFLVGRKDKTDSKRLSMEDLLGELDHTYPIIVMDHQPSELNQAQMHGADLLLSGHTHRGQMAPNNLITRKVFELDWGHLQKSQLHTIVSSGYGFWGPPLRIGSRSEIVLIEMSFEG